MQDDLTLQLTMIIRQNENLREHMRDNEIRREEKKKLVPAHIISEFAQSLQFHVAAYFDNELPGQQRVRLLKHIDMSPGHMILCIS